MGGCPEGLAGGGPGEGTAGAEVRGGRSEGDGQGGGKGGCRSRGCAGEGEGEGGGGEAEGGFGTDGWEVMGFRLVEPCTSMKMIPHSLIQPTSESFIHCISRSSCSPIPKRSGQ